MYYYNPANLSFNLTTYGSTYNPTIYLNADTVQNKPQIMVNLSSLQTAISSQSFSYDYIDAADFDVVGLVFDDRGFFNGSHYAIFDYVGFNDGWVGSIAIDDLQQNIFDAGSTNNILPINLEGDTVAPTASIELVQDPRKFDAFLGASFTGPELSKDYFLVSFSEDVTGFWANSNYTVSNGYKVDNVYVPPWMPGSDMYDDQILVQVSEVIPGSTTSDPTLGLNSRLDADIVSLASPPTNVDTYVSSSTSTGSENWSRLDLSHDVSKYAFLMQTTLNGQPTFEFWNGAINLMPSNMMPPYPNVTGVAFSQGADQVDEIFIRTNIPIDSATTSVGFGAATSYITDQAVNYLSNSEDGAANDVVTIDSATVQSPNGITMIAPPASGGFDTLRVVLAGDVYVDANDEILENYYIQVVNGADVQGFDIYKFEGSNFSRYEIDATTVSFDGFAGDSEVVALYRIGNNDINLVSSGTDVETDIVDYSAVSDDIQVDLSEANLTNDWYVDVSVIGGTIDQVDTLRGAEGVVGGSGDDHITGNGIDNLLVGGGGADRLDGDDGDDILVGGDSSSGIDDVLLGGKGQDMLIDLDGASMTGGLDDRPLNSTAPKDIYVVRTGSTIQDYKTAEQNAGLAGRAVGNINDIIAFNVSLAELAFQINNGVAGLSSAEMNEIAANIKIHVSNSDSDPYWEVTATSHIVSEGLRINLSLGDVEVMAPVNQGQSLTIVPLDDNYFDHPDTGDIFSQNIDNFVLDNTLPDLVASLNEEGSFNLAFALEETRDGVVRSNGQTLMFGDFAKVERIFNPGNASEMIFGSRGTDTYEFLVQDFRTTNIDSAVAQDVGDDIIRDTGGLDTVLFSGLNLETISKLNFEAVRVGREKGQYSLKTNYDQTENGFVNEGSFTWTGHFREGFDMQLEKIRLGDDVLSLAQNIYNYDKFGRLLSNTPIQQALEGEDTILVGKSGRDGDDNIFKLDKNGTAPIEQTDLFIWGIDSANDVIDLSEFIIPVAAIEGFLEQDLVRQKLDEFNAPIQGTFEVDLDNNISNYELTIHFMGSSVSQASLEQMILNAYTTST